MADIYYYVPNSEAKDALTCGLKLSEWGEKEIEYEGITKNCLVALLNPKDDKIKYNSAEFTCLRLEIKLRHCFVADKLLYQAGQGNADVMQLYIDSIIPAENYIFGTYRIPECLVTSTVISDQIEVLDQCIDLPILYENSEELYKINLIENYREEYKNFDDMMLYSFNMKLVEAGKAIIIEDEETGIAIFIDIETNLIFTVKIPSFE